MTFEALVKKMREAQKAYDKSATNDRRIAAIKAQDAVDSYLAKLPVVAGVEQGRLL